MISNEDMLVKLLEQAAIQGANHVILRAIVEEAAELGAERAIKRLQPEAPKMSLFERILGGF